MIEKGFLRGNHITIILYFVTQDFFVIEIELSVKFHKFSYVFMIATVFILLTALGAY